MSKYQELVKSQRQFFAEGHTRTIQFRLGALATLEGGVRRYESALYAALEEDFGKSPYEAYMTEIGVVLGEIRFLMRHLRTYLKPKRQRPRRLAFPAKGRIYRDPYGVALIFSPWNYPVFLTIAPLAGAIAGGNTAILNPSPKAFSTAKVIGEMLNSCFEEDYISAITSDSYVTEELLQEAFDTIFFTGSPDMGRLVMEKAAAHLTPVTLELGGKSPCIVEKTADLKRAARRIVWGKYINAGQTCVAPDYLLVEQEVEEELIHCLEEEIQLAYGEDPLENPDYASIIDGTAFHRLAGYLSDDEPYWGGEMDAERLRMAPALLHHPALDSAVMQEEIFGPILPIIGVKSWEEAARFVQKKPHPLALYLFTKNKMVEEKVMEGLTFGGGCVNDCVLHLAAGLPFGGVGNSGMGRYLGQSSFETFTYEKSVLRRRSSFDWKQRFAPYSSKNFQSLKRMM